MASFDKYCSYQTGRLLQHNNRSKGDGVQHNNERIEEERTELNYSLKQGSVETLKKRLGEVFYVPRKTTAVLGEIVVTLPQDVRRGDERGFFQTVYDFYVNDFGEENIVNAVVHKDEDRPHMHLDFVPVVKGVPEMTQRHAVKALAEWYDTHGEYPTERVCCKEKINRSYLQKMHKRLSEFVKEKLGYFVEILNGATANGNKTVTELKTESLKKELEQMEKEKEYLNTDINQMVTLARRHGIEKQEIGLTPLMQKIADLERQNEIMHRIITRQGYRWTKEDLDEMREQKYVPAKSISVNVYEGSLVNEEIERDAVVVIDMYDRNVRPLPQQQLIDADSDLERQLHYAQQDSGRVVVRTSKISDKTYIFLKSDNVSQTINNLLQLERIIGEQRLYKKKLYIDQLETDTYDLARSILQTNNIETNYYVKTRSQKRYQMENDIEMRKE